MSSSVNLTNSIITGLGCITPDGVFSSMQTKVRKDMNLPFKSKLISHDLKEYIGSKGFRFHDRSAKLGLVASKICLTASGLLGHYNSEDVSVVVGSNGALQSQMTVVLEAIKNPQFMNPSAYPNRGCNVIAGQISLMFGLRGESTVISSHYRSGVDALIYAVRKIEKGASPYLVVGTEALSDARDKRTCLSNNNIDMIEGAIAMTIENTKVNIGSNRKGPRVIGYKQFICTENFSWEIVAEKFIKPFGLSLNEVSYVYGRDATLEIKSNSKVYRNPYELFGAGVLLGLAYVILSSKNIHTNILLVSADEARGYSMLLLNLEEGSRATDGS